MLVRALDAGVNVSWVAGDGYGQSPDLRAELEMRGVGYVLAIASSHRVGFDPTSCRADQLLAFYRCYTSGPVPLGMLVKVAGRRWTIEEAFQTGKGLCGLDQHQVRRWKSWYRSTSPARWCPAAT